MASERLDELRAMHRPVARDDRDENGQPIIIRVCYEDDHDWPCETAFLLDLLAERDAEIARLRSGMEARALCIALFNSMILSGESHSDQSRVMLRAALAGGEDSHKPQ